LMGVGNDIRVVVRKCATMADRQMAILDVHAQDDQVFWLKLQVGSKSKR
jgi:hypothetical protein